MVEHLLCKQGVIGSNPIVSRPQLCRGRLFSPGVRGTAPRCLLAVASIAVMGKVPGSAVSGLPPRAWGGWAVPYRPPGSFAGAVLFFCVVNLVLVRLWTRRTARLWSGGCPFGCLAWIAAGLVRRTAGCLSDRKGSRVLALAGVRGSSNPVVWQCSGACE